MLDWPGPSAAPASSTSFDRALAFSRTRGWVTAEELGTLRGKRVAIAGMGGVGGAHLLTLARLGIGRFHVADHDVFEVENVNRQAGASMRTLGRPKVEVMAEMATDVIPDLELATFPDGVDADRVEPFLDGVDLYVDGLDLFAIEPRRRVFEACARRGIPAITAAPLGMGAAVLVFLPGKMTFERYFGLEGHDPEGQVLRFLVGLAPRALHRHYLVDPSTLDLAAQRAPSTPMAVDLCAGVAATNALKILLGRGRVLAAPWGLQLDAYQNRAKRTWRPGGHRNPLQQLWLFMTRRALRRPWPGLHR